MDVVRRIVRTINFSYVLFAALAVALLYAFTTPVVIDPLIAFLLAGIIPGTDIILAPEIVLLALTDLFGLALVALLITWLVRRRLLADIDYQQVAAAVLAPEAQPERRGAMSTVAGRIAAARAIRRADRLSAKATRAAQAQAVPAKVKPPLQPLTGPRLLAQLTTTTLTTLGWYIAAGVLTVAAGVLAMASMLARLLIYCIGLLLITVRFLVVAMIEGVVQIGRLLIAGGRLLIHAIVWLMVFIIVVLGTLIDQSIRLARFAWVRIHPFLRRFDTWLELRYRQLARFVARRYQQSEMLQVAVMVTKESARSLRRKFYKF